MVRTREGRRLQLRLILEETLRQLLQLTLPPAVAIYSERGSVKLLKLPDCWFGPLTRIDESERVGELVRALPRLDLSGKGQVHATVARKRAPARQIMPRCAMSRQGRGATNRKRTGNSPGPAPRTQRPKRARRHPPCRRSSTPTARHRGTRGCRRCCARRRWSHLDRDRDSRSHPP